jgi:CubicO group peptidase (beta-lactamase class C family)
MMNQETFSAVINQLETVLDKKGNHLNMASIIVSDGHDQYCHYFKDKTTVDIRSIAKPIVCMAIGAAIEKGLYFDGIKIGLETPIWQFLSKYTTVKDPENVRQWQKEILMDCFRITMGHDKGLMFSADIREHDENELVEYVVNYPITREIGRDFVYSNAGTFLVSTLITEYLGKNLDECVNEYIFSPMGISDYSWKKFGKYCAGCTGLKMQNEDLHKIGRLLIDNGVYEGRQLVPSSWIERMREPQVPSPTHRYVADRAFPKWSYGMNLWICQDGNYYCDGSEGQYLIVIPGNNIVITAMGYQTDTEPVSNCLGAWKNARA